MLPLVTVITSSLNDAHNLSLTLQQVSSWGYPNIEYIIVDGGSTDNTIEVVRSYGSLVSHFINEPDAGIYDAWNKGIRIASGEYIAFLGAGDSYVPRGLCKLVDCAEQQPSADYISSKVAVRDGARVISVFGKPWCWKCFRRYMNTAHPGSLHSKRLFHQYGQFDISYKIAGDYEFLLRPGPELQTAFLDEITVNMVAGGISCFGYRVFEEEERAKNTHMTVPQSLSRMDRCIHTAKRWGRIYLGY